AQPLPTAQHGELDRMDRRRGGFDDRVAGALMGMAEHREQRLSVAVVDRVIAPYAARDIAAVEPQQLVQFGAREIERAARAPIVPQRQHRRIIAEHRRPSSVPAVIILTIYGRASSRLAAPQASRLDNAVRPVAAVPRARMARFASPRPSGYGDAPF